MVVERPVGSAPDEVHGRRLERHDDLTARDELHFFEGLLGHQSHHLRPAVDLHAVLGLQTGGVLDDALQTIAGAFLDGAAFPLPDDQILGTQADQDTLPRPSLSQRLDRRPFGLHAQQAVPFTHDATVQDRLDTHEPRHLLRTGMSEYLGHPADLPDAAVGHDRDPVAQAQRLLPIVGDEDGGAAGLPEEALEKRQQIGACRRVECGEGLVEQKDFVWGLIASMYLSNIFGLIIVLSTVPLFAAILRIPFSIIAPVIIVVCAIGAYSVHSAMLDIWFMVLFGAVGYVLKKLDYPLAPLVLSLVLGDRAEAAFRQTMMGSKGELGIFWSNSLVGSITTLALIMLFWPLISIAWRRLRPRQRGQQ